MAVSMWIRLLVLGAALLTPAFAADLDAELTASVTETQVAVGNPFSYTITFQYIGPPVNDPMPSTPDWGGLQLRGGPNISRHTTISGRERLTAKAYTWTLVATREGRYTIGRADLRMGGQLWTTKPITITVTEQPTHQLPPTLADMPIASARTNNAELNRRLSGRLFLRAELSNREPYVGEPVIVTYALYNDGAGQLGQLSESVGQIEGAIVENLFHAGQVNFQSEIHGGKSYLRSEMYRIAVIPGTPGELTFQGYAMSGTLPLRRGRQTSPFPDPFLNDPFFGRSIAMEIPSPLVRLDVRPLPVHGAPEDFNGTVGGFRVEAEIDRTQATLDDLLTLRVRVSGRGAIELAAPPEWAASPDFELVGQDAETETRNLADRMGGTKTFELLLRPMRSGTLRVPALRYPLFDPFEERYRVEQTMPVEVRIAPGAGGQTRVTALPDEAEAGAAAGALDDLRYLKPIGGTWPGSPGVLIESPLPWLGLAAGFGFLLFSWRRDERRTRMDPAQARRAGAWSQFDRRVAEVHELLGEDNALSEAAGAADHALRALIADHFNLAADGLTRPQIERLLRHEAMPDEDVRQVCDLMETLSMLHYAPGAAQPAETRDHLRRALDDARRVLHAGLAAG